MTSYYIGTYAFIKGKHINKNLKIFSWLYLIISCITIGIVTTVFLIIRAETDEPKVKKKVVHRRRIKKVKKVKVRKVRKVKVKKATKVRRRRKKKVTDKPIEQVTKEVTPSTEVVQ